MSFITIWEAFNKQDQCWEHNHIEDGWVEGLYPLPKGTGTEYEMQKKSWRGGQWIKHYGYLVGVGEPRRALTKGEYYRELGLRG